MLNKCYLSLISATAYVKDTRYCLVIEVLLLVDVGLSNISERCLRDKKEPSIREPLLLTL